MSSKRAPQLLQAVGVWSLVLCLTAAVEETRGLGFLDSTQVLLLNSNSFEKALAKHEAVLVEFVRPFCDICNASATLEFRLASCINKHARDSLLFAYVNAETHENLTRRLKIEAFPTIALFLNASPVVYAGRRHPESLLSWVSERRKFEPPSIDAQALSGLRARPSASLVFVGAAGKELDAFRRFAKTSPSLATYFLNASQADPGLQAELGLSGRGWSVALVGLQRGLTRVFEEPAVALPSLQAFVEKHRHPLVGDFSGLEALERVFYQEGTSIIYLSNGLKDRFLKTFAALASANRDTLKFFVARPKDPHSQELTDYLGLAKDPPRQLWLIHNHAEGVDSYKYDSRLTPGGLRAFLKRFFSGHLLPGVSNVADSSIVWDMADPEVVLQLRKSNSTIVVFNYQKRLCRKRAACRHKLRVFKRFASRLHNLPGLEFATLDLGRGYRVTKGRFYWHFRAAMPALTVSLPSAEEPRTLPLFDWTFRSLQKWVDANLRPGPQAS